MKRIPGTRKFWCRHSDRTCPHERRLGPNPRRVQSWTSIPYLGIRRGSIEPARLEPIIWPWIESMSPSRHRSCAGA